MPSIRAVRVAGTSLLSRVKLSVPVKALGYQKPLYGRLIKNVFRIANTKNCFQDICGTVVFNINEEKNKNLTSIIAVWINSNTDNHSTSKRKNYVAY